MKLSLRCVSRQIAVVCAILAFTGSTSSAFAAQRAKFQEESRVPAAVKSGEAKLVSHADSKQEYELAIALPVRDEAGLDALIPSLYDRSSPNYHHYLTVQQFADRFAPSPADYAKVVKFARDNGFNVTVEHANRLVVSFTGTTEQIERAFHVKMNNYQHPTEERMFYAPDREPTVDGLDVPVLLIAGLDNYVQPHSHLRNYAREHGITGHPATEREMNGVISHANPPVTCAGPPNSVDVGSGPCNTYTPANARTAYYGGTALTGSGLQIGILGFGGLYPADLTGFAAVENMTAPTVVFKLGSACANSCSDGEQMLDVLWSGGMAPGITEIDFFSNASNDLTMINAEASSTVDSVYSCSWGWGFGNHTAEDTDFKEMAAQGQTFLNATGDDGGYNSTTWAFPSGDPYITEVGGTQLITNGIGGSWSAEKAWPDSSGGVPPTADSYAIPTWQVPAVNSSNGISSTKRSDPDIAAEADYEMLGCGGSKKNGNTCEDTYGGTSYAAPTWAGFITLINQASIAAGNGAVGFINYDLYTLGVSSLYSANMHDVTLCGGIDANEGPGPDCNSSDEGTPVTGFNPVAGFDDVTGWGAPSPALIATLSVPVYSITPTSGTTATSFSNTISYPDVSGAVVFDAKVGTSGTPTSTANCTLTNTACSASFTGSKLGVGTYNGYAVYTEVETYGSTTRTVAKTSNLMSFTIADNVSVSASASPSSITTAQSSTVTATVTDSSNSANVLTGSVSFAAGATSLGSCTLSSGTCSVSVAGSTLGVGSYTIIPTYTPAAGYTVTSTTDASLTVTGTTVPPTTATVSAVSSPYASTTGVTVTATESGSAGAVTGGVVTFGDVSGGGSFSPTTCTLPAGGSCTTSYLPSGVLTAGTYTGDITASFSAVGGYSTANASNTLTITPVTPTLTISNVTEVQGQVIGRTGDVIRRTMGQIVTATGGRTGCCVVGRTSTGPLPPSGVVTFGTAGGIGGTFSPTTCTLSNGTCSVTYFPSGTLSPGTYTNDLTGSLPASADYNAATGAGTLTVTGTTGGAITFSSVSHNFGQVAVDTAATAYGLTITNSSTTTAYPFSLVFTAANGFTQANNCGISIAAGAKCQLNFNFTPTKTGAVSATWSLASETGFTYSPSNGGTLQGSGTSNGGVSLTTNGHNFGTVAVGSTSATYGTELSNSTTTAENLSLGTVSAPFHMLTNCGTTLAAGSSCEIEFYYMPTTTSPVSVVVPLSGSPTAITSGGAALPSGGITLSGN